LPSSTHFREVQPNRERITGRCVDWSQSRPRIFRVRR
jgi:hypothetical protein